MSDALVSPAVGGAMWAATAAMTALAARKVERSGDEARVPLMGVLGAFVFAAQMVNFSIPGTGSSGHLGGGLLLAALLGPHAAFLVMTSVLTVQALFFADGGLLALGCNVFNLAFFSSYVAYPLLWRPLAGRSPGLARLVCASVTAGIVSLLLGAGGVVVETVLSGISSLPFAAFARVMLSIHLAIGLVEGLVTAVVLLVIWRARPEVILPREPMRPRQLRALVGGLAVAALLIGGVLSWFASTRPDGLEWTVAKVAGEERLASPPGGVHALLARLQTATAVMPDYAFHETRRDPQAARGVLPAVSAGSSAAGLLGGLLVVGVAVALTTGLRALFRRSGDR